MLLQQAGGLRVPRRCAATRRPDLSPRRLCDLFGGDGPRPEDLEAAPLRADDRRLDPDGAGTAVLVDGTVKTRLNLVSAIADPRTNRIVIMTRPSNVAYLRSLVLEFDRAVQADQVVVAGVAGGRGRGSMS